MNKGFTGQQSQAGQTAVLFALMIVGLVVFIGLAVDGGSVFNGRRVAQNAADSAALTGVHYMVGTDAPTETRLLQVVNGVIEANNVPDTDGTAGNEINDNVSLYYTNARGGRLTTFGQPCDVVGECGSIPTTARGLEVVIDHQVATYFLGVINRDSLDVGADAVAIVSGGTGGASIGDNVLVAFGSCSEGERPLDSSASGVDFIGSVYSSSWFVNRGGSRNNENHYHGQVYYGSGWSDTADEPGVYYPNPPEQSDPIGDPLAHLGLTVERFSCSGDIGGSVTCYDLTVHAPDYGNAITTQLLKQRSPDGGDPFLIEIDRDTWQLRPGLYYGGDYPFDFGEQGVVGNVTLVSNSYIKITEDDLQLTGYMPPGTPVPGLLLYSALDPSDGGYNACTNHEDLPEEWEPINTTGNSASSLPGVYHADDRAGCIDLDNPSDCYEMGSLRYIGLLYAPYGRVATSGDGATYVGGIIAPSIRINGFKNRREGSRDDPDQVGALFVRDPTLFPPTQQLISLER